MRGSFPAGRAARASAWLAVVGLALAASIVSSCEGPVREAQREPAGLDAPANVDRQIIVRLKSPWGQARVVNGGDRHLRAMIAPDARVETIHGDLYRVEIPAGQDPDAVLRRLRGSGSVEHVEPDQVVRHFGRPNDPLLSQQWAHAVVKSEEAWDLGQGSPQVVVAVIDTGIDPQHPDLAPNVWRNPGETPGNGRDDDGNGYVDDVFGYDFANRDGDPTADDSPHFHGTHVSGTIGAVADNGVGGAGHAPRVRLMALKFLTASGGGQISHAIQAIYYAVANGAKIISNSWGGSSGSVELSRAIEAARQAGVLFVVAAGNGGQDGVGDNNDSVPTYPAVYTHDNVITVAATERSDNLTRFSNFGPRTVHLGAPGEGILSAQNGGRHQFMSGTSMATPLVSGVLATMIARRPDLSYRDIRRLLLENVDSVPGLRGRVSSNGRVNAFRAIAAVGGPAPSPSPTSAPTPSPTASPSPTPSPSPTATPTGAPGVAVPPRLAGHQSVRVKNPYLTIPIEYDVSAFPEAAGAYLEVSRPNQSFTNPNGDVPDPQRQTFATIAGLRNRLNFVPAGNLPGWGVYQFRVIPIRSDGFAAGRFSNPATLDLRP